ncbi:MAG: 50S ribosomal protein L6 [Candidatus Bathyarchaeota archaeon]|nr:50S ribosomal protein L6 [Candidatus Bathyarchaeota archaeon]
MTVQIVEKSVMVSDDVNLTLDGHKVAVTGTNGTVVRDFAHTKLNIDYQDNTLRVWVVNPKKKQASLVNTITSHINNMIKGVTDGFTYRLKIVFIHFPMNFEVRQNEFIINNFVGEQNVRIAKLHGDVQVRVEGDDVIVTGANIEHVAQTAANIQQATKIRNKDLRKFLDGIYVYKKE